MKIFLIGWFGSGNMGDEAILLSEILSLKKKFNNAGFYVLSFCAERTKKLTSGIPEVEKVIGMGSKFGFLKSDFGGLINCFRNADMVIIGGGGIFQDIYNHYPIPFFTSMSLLARFFGKKLALHCVGIGPIRTILGRTLCRIAVNSAHTVSVRDTESKNLLSDIGVKKEIHVSADPVFLLTPESSERVKKILDKHDAEGISPLIGVCVHNLLSWNDEGRNIFAGALDYLALEKKARIIFIPMGMYRDTWFHGNESEPVDILASRELAQLMKNNGTVITEELNPQEMMSLIGSLDMIISMRLHGLIMGIATGVPVISVTFKKESKIASLMKKAGRSMDVFYANELDIETMIERVEDILARNKEIKSEIREQAAVLIREAEKGIELLSLTT